MIGYVFRDARADVQRDDIMAFLDATQEAKAILRESDAEWERLRPLMRAENEATFVALRDGYRQGIPTQWGRPQREEAAKLFAILAEYGGVQLVGPSNDLTPGTFWPHFSY